MEEDNKPLVSIVVPVYNSEAYLQCCIESILNQDYADFELLLIDDDSTDHSGEVCKCYEQKDKRISYYIKKHGGLSDTRNFGVRHASANSRFICFVDSDDSIEPQYLNYLIAGMKDVQLSICHIRNLYEADNENQSNLLVDPMGLIEYSDIKNNLKFIELFQTGILNSSCNKLYRLDIIRSNSIIFPPDVIIVEDLVFNLRYLRYCHRVNEITNELYNYFHHDGSLVSKVSPEAYESYLNIRNEMIDFFGDRFEKPIDLMVYRQFESISIKLLEKNQTDKVSEYITQKDIHYIISQAQVANWWDRVIKFMLSHNYVKLLRRLILITK